MGKEQTCVRCITLYADPLLDFRIASSPHPHSNETLNAGVEGARNEQMHFMRRPAALTSGAPAWAGRNAGVRLRTDVVK